MRKLGWILVPLLAVAACAGPEEGCPTLGFSPSYAGTVECMQTTVVPGAREPVRFVFDDEGKRLHVEYEVDNEDGTTSQVREVWRRL